MRGLRVRRDTYVSVAGTDLVRHGDGGFAVLEDNLRVPSGVSYMLANRQVMKRVFPRPVRALQRPADRSLRPGAARDAARAGAAPVRRADDRAADAGRVQLGLLRAHVPRAADGHRAGRRARPLRSRQRRLHADDRRSAARRRHLSPRRRRLHGPADVPQAIRSWAWPACSTPSDRATSRWRTRSAPASPTTRRSTRYVPEMIRFYLDEEPILPNVETFLLTDPLQRRHVLGNLGSLVVKAVGESGGYGMLIGPHSTAGRARRVRAAHRSQSAELHRAADARTLTRALLHRGRRRGPARRSPALHPLQRPGDRRPRRPDARRAAPRIARRQLVARRRKQGHLGVGVIRKPCSPQSVAQTEVSSPMHAGPKGPAYR